MTFRFRKKPQPTGLYSIGKLFPDTLIKYKKTKVGYISAPSWHTADGKWRIWFITKELNTWKLTAINSVFNTESDAREWIKNNAKSIIALNLYF